MVTGQLGQDGVFALFHVVMARSYGRECVTILLYLVMEKTVQGMIQIPEYAPKEHAQVRTITQTLFLHIC